MTPKLRHLLPGLLELSALGCLTILLLLLGNSHQLISYFGLSSAGSVIHQSTGNTITTSLSKLDDFGATKDIVSFAIWALVGIVSLSLLRAVSTVYKDIRYEEAVSSNRYIHPNTFKRSSFWQHVLLDALGFISYLALLMILLYCMVAFIMPVGLTYARQFTVSNLFPSLGKLLLGWFVLFCGVTVLYSNFKLLLYRRHIFSSRA